MFSLWYSFGFMTGKYPQIQNETLFRRLHNFVASLLQDNTSSEVTRCFESEIFHKSAFRITVYGSTLEDVIYPQINIAPCGLGVYAPDPDSYDVFNEIFNQVIKIYHDNFRFSQKTPPSFYGDPKRFLDIDPMKNYVLSTKIRVVRNLEGFPYAPKLTLDQFVQVERMIKLALMQLSAFDTGWYHSLDNLLVENEKKLCGLNFLFTNNDPILKATNAYRFWPKGRGIWYNVSKTILIWINEVDHLRLMSMQRGGNFRDVYKTFIRYLTFLESRLEFHIHDRLGHLSFSPLNIGTAMKVSCKMHLPNFSSSPQYLEVLHKMCEKRGIMYAPSECESGQFMMWNRKCLDITEFEILLQMQEALCDIIRVEKKIAEGLELDPERTCMYM